MVRRFESCVGRDTPESAHAFEWTRRVDDCWASSLLVRRESWERLGGLEEAFFPAYCQDVDISLRVAAEGGKVWYEPTSRMGQPESTSSSDSKCP
jgi:GT2 family glycosyltransferase